MWLAGVVNRRWVESMGVVSECCCKEVYYIYPHNNYYFPLLHLYYIALFLATSSLFLCSFLNVFFVLSYIAYDRFSFCALDSRAKRAQ